MCLIVVAWQAHARYDLLLAANRDEFHARPTRPAHVWSEPAGLVAGRDETAGGAWCGADATGRFAAVTNIRELQAGPAAASRGALVLDYFAAGASAREWAEHVAAVGPDYGPFNLLVGDRERLFHVANRGPGGPRAIAPGVVAISNGHWGDRWPKTEAAVTRLRERIASDDCAPESLLALLHDREPAAAVDLPQTGVDRSTERFLSPMFIQSPTYGTRATTVLRRDRAGHVDFTEQGFDPTGQAVHRVQHNWSTETGST